MSAQYSGAKRLLNEIISMAMPRAASKKIHFENILTTMRARSKLLDLRKITMRDLPKHLKMVIEVAKYIAVYQGHSKQFIWNWRVPEGSHHVQLSSLIQFMFAEYPVPDFMTNVWLKKSERTAKNLRMYIDLGKGHSVRKMNLPIALNKAMAKFLMNAPKDLNVFEALRWSQVMGLGGTDKLARCLLLTRLAKETTDETFWTSVIRFLIANDPISCEEICEIVQFLDNQKFQPGRRFIYWGRDAPLQAGFSMRGRTLRSIRRHMANWETELTPLPVLPPKPRPKITTYWRPVGFEPFEKWIDGKRWIIHEILNSNELTFEGHKMCHCVGTYRKKCQRGDTSIWSLRSEDDGTWLRKVTIEVLPDGQVTQVKAKYNSAPSQWEMEIIKNWAEENELSLR